MSNMLLFELESRRDGGSRGSRGSKLFLRSKKMSQDKAGMEETRQLCS